MSHALRTAGASRPAAAKPQSRPSISDQLDRLTPEWDALAYRARLGTNSAREYDALEEQAQAFAARLLTIFRGRSVAPRVRVSADGMSVGG